MKNIYLRLVSTSGLLILAAACHQSVQVELTLPTSQDYRAIQDAQNWLNPYLIVEQTGVTVICRALGPNRRTHIAVDELGSFLNNLPPAAWPYGRIVGAQENGIRSTGAKNQANDNKAKIEHSLAAFSIQVNWWPSA